MRQPQAVVPINQDEIAYYLREVRGIKATSDDEQQLIQKRLQELKKNPDSKELKRLHNRLIEINLRFVISVAKDYVGKGLDISELIAEGNAGLIKALEHFDPDKNIKFISYAVHWIRQSILQAMYDNARTIRLPVNVAQSVTKTLNRKPQTEAEQEMLFMYEELNPANVPFTINLEQTLDDEGSTLLDILENKDAEKPDAIFNTGEELRAQLHSVLKVLDDRERNIIENYYGISGYARTLEEIGEDFNLTKERVRQIKDKAIRKLRDHAAPLFDLI